MRPTGKRAATARAVECGGPTALHPDGRVWRTGRPVGASQAPRARIRHALQETSGRGLQPQPPAHRSVSRRAAASPLPAGHAPIQGRILVGRPQRRTGPQRQALGSGRPAPSTHLTGAGRRRGRGRGRRGSRGVAASVYPLPQSRSPLRPFLAALRPVLRRPPPA
jgi:hypothetical protein